jgi:hypothetical protein
MNLALPDDIEIAETAREIEALEGVENNVKLDLILILAGQKSATEILNANFPTPGRPHVDPNDLKQKLFELGFECKAVGEDPPFESQNIYVGLTQHDVQQLKTATETKDRHKMGEIYGFPKTAITAYCECENPPTDMLEIRDLPPEISQSSYAPFCQFALSPLNWREEIKTAQKWRDTIHTYSPTLYEERQALYRESMDRRIQLAPLTNEEID